MATNTKRWVGNAYGLKGPLVMLGKFQAGSTQAVKVGELLLITGGYFSPVTANYASTADLAIANEEIKANDLEGYYEIIVPRIGDIFEYEIATAAATAVGTALKHSTSEVIAAQGGSGNIVAYACGQEHYPKGQGHLADGDYSDRGTTVRTASRVRVMFTEAASYFAALQT